MFNKDDINKILDGAENIQKEMHQLIDVISTDPRYKKVFHAYDSLKDVYFMMKISELQQEIELLKNKK